MRVSLFLANPEEEELHENMLRLRRLLLLPYQLDELLYPRMLLQPSEKVILLTPRTQPGSSCVCSVQNASSGTSRSMKQHVQGWR